MRRVAGFVFVFMLIALTLVSTSYAQTVAITPTMPSVAVGNTLQFSAQVNGGTASSITWLAAGVAGGNATGGTISSTGLYKAPASLPGQNPVQITANATVNGKKISSTTYVNILSLGPVITSVSPNPLPVGTLNVTIRGTGFVAGAQVLDTYGTYGAIQMVTTAVTPTSVTATGYQGPASSASFCVKNPGSICSNSLAVPVGSSAPAKYTLTVVNGTGSGSYAAGASVPISAVVPSGQTFVNWTGATVANATSASTTITMPAANTTVTANFTAAPPPKFTLTVVNGTGSGSYTAGTSVPISANAPPQGQVFQSWTGATVTSATSASTTLTMPAANATVTATYTAATTPTYTLSVVNGSGSGNYAAGATVAISANAAPAGQVFVNWSGATVANPSAASTTLVMPAAYTTVTANFASTASSSIPYPVSTHPRLWVTVNDLPRLRSWATSSNQVYQKGLVPVLQTAVSLYNTQFFPGGNPNPNYPDPGDTQGYTGYLTEEYGGILAFNSLIDPNPANRILYAQYARNMLMYAMNQAALGTMSGAPFRDRLFATYNRASGSGELWPLIVDWIYNAVDASGNPILTASDKATIRNVFLMWSAACETASTTGGDSPQIPGVTNSLQLLPNNLPYRFAANNYYTAHARLMTMMALAIDPTDDPPVNAAQSATVIGNSLRSYLSDALGAWLYQQYAMYGEGPTVAAAYGVPANGAGFGLASGGLPPEGMLYGVSYGNLLSGLLALQTAGFNNAAYASYTGPQIGMIATPMWDRYVKGVISSLIPAPITPTSPGESYLGQVYQFAAYGDLLRFYVTPDYMMPFALLALLEQQNGQSTHLADARWFNYNVVQGGPPAFYQRMTNPYTLADTILYYMLYDPSVAYTAAADPRPGYSTIFYDPGASRIVAHTDWSPTGTMFDYRASWESINHMDGNAGQFELYRKGEWLTKELSNYDNNGVGMTVYYHNTLGLQNTCSSCTPSAVINWWETGELANGSQWMIGENAGDPTTQTSNGPGYVYANTDMTNLYNRPNQWTPGNSLNNITQATRSIVWLNNDYIVVYDRATSLNAGLFKRWNLTLITNPAINGKVATETLPSGQQLFVQSLLPASSTITARNVLADLTTVAELEPSQFVMTVQDPSNPSDTRFLHVLQGADKGVAMVPAAYVQSSSGTAFDGAVFGSMAVYFPVNAKASFTGTTLPAPAGVHTALVTGLAANTSYTVTVSGNAISVTPGAGTTTDAAGLLRLSF